MSNIFWVACPQTPMLCMLIVFHTMPFVVSLSKGLIHCYYKPQASKILSTGIITSTLSYNLLFKHCHKISMRACVCPPLRLLITIGVIWTLYDWLKKFYSFYMATLVSTISRHSLTIEMHNRNQPNKSKLVLYKPLLTLTVI